MNEEHALERKDQKMYTLSNPKQVGYICGELQNNHIHTHMLASPTIKNHVPLSANYNPSNAGEENASLTCCRHVVHT